MNKNTILRIFGEAFLRAMVIIMLIAILGFGGFFLVKVISNGANKDEAVTTEELSDEELQALLAEEATAEDGSTVAATEATEASETTEATSEETVSSTEAKILVLNSTETKGLAAAWADKLKAAGFTNVETGNYSAEELTDSKIVVTEEGKPYLKSETQKMLMNYFYLILKSIYQLLKI